LNAVRLVPAYSDMYRIGIDLGGTKLRALSRPRRQRNFPETASPTEREHGYRHILNRLKSLHDELVVAAPGLTTFGIGTPGAISPQNRLAEKTPTPSA